MKLAEENDQLADWLEELKAYRANATETKCKPICLGNSYDCGVSKGGCNKSDDVGCIDCAIQKAIEIVKRGGKNE